jgi:hypothetical protein
LKVNCDLQLTLIANTLCRLLTVRIGDGYEIAKTCHLYRDLIKASAGVCITDQAIMGKSQRRAHNPLLIAAGLDKTDLTIPWLRGRRLRLVYGCLILVPARPSCRVKE